MQVAVIENTLTDIFREVFDNSSLTLARSMTAKDVKDWDSFNHVRLIVTVEQKFGISLPTHEVVNLRNVGELIDLIGKYLARRNSEIA